MSSRSKRRVVLGWAVGAALSSAAICTGQVIDANILANPSFESDDHAMWYPVWSKYSAEA